MKKFFVFLFTLVFVLLVGCGDDNLLYQDSVYTITKGENGANVSIEATASNITSVYDEAKSEIDTKTMPCLSILKYSDNTLTVSAFNYDGDAKDEFELWELSCADNVIFKSITVINDNGNVSVENVVLPEEQEKYIGEYYTYGFFEFDNNAKVSKVIFYGENIIEG